METNKQMVQQKPPKKQKPQLAKLNQMVNGEKRKRAKNKEGTKIFVDGTLTSLPVSSTATIFVQHCDEEV